MMETPEDCRPDRMRERDEERSRSVSIYALNVLMWP
jgi:hypothetical protein